MSQFTLETLESIIAARAGAPVDQSYTASLIAKGVNKCAEKLGEEATEAVIAAVTGDRSGLTQEAADVLYHLLVLLRISEIPLDDVMKELDARTQQTGHQEKASRN